MSGTASNNVSILEENFYFPSLQRTRRIWVYKPSGYEGSDERYPVIYMHDGQNLFDEATAFGSEWRVDETLDALEGKVIIIGIENGIEHRMNEYMIHDHPRHGEADGAKYLNDISEVLKPFVDAALRTLADRQHTCICGSSMGGLISLYAGFYFRHVFGSIAILSPALWFDAPAVFNEAKEFVARLGSDASEPRHRWYVYAGALESGTIVAETATLVSILQESPVLDITSVVDPGGTHDEAVWGDHFREVYDWFVLN